MKKIFFLAFLLIACSLNLLASEKLKLINLRDRGDNNLALKDVVDSTKAFYPPMQMIDYGHTEVFFQNKLVDSFKWWRDTGPTEFKTNVYWSKISPEIYVVIGVSVPQEGAKGIYIIERGKVSLTPIVSSVCWREGLGSDDLTEKIDTVKYFSTFSIHEARVDTLNREITIKYDRIFRRITFYRNIAKATFKY